MKSLFSRGYKMLKEEFDKAISSKGKHILVTGTDFFEKHWKVLRYLNSLNKKLKILIRINSMQNCEHILKTKFRTGISQKIGNLTIYVDSLNVKSQENTPKEFNCIIVYPIGSLSGIEDTNIIDILKYRNSEKVFWVSCQDNNDYSYLKEVCDISNEIAIDDENIENNNVVVKKDNIFDKLLVKGLGSHYVEDAISKRYNLGNIYTSGMGNELTIGSFEKYSFFGKKSKTVAIKVKEEKENDMYVLLVSECKSR